MTAFALCVPCALLVRPALLGTPTVRATWCRDLQDKDRGDETLSFISHCSTLIPADTRQRGAERRRPPLRLQALGRLPVRLRDQRLRARARQSTSLGALAATPIMSCLQRSSARTSDTSLRPPSASEAHGRQPRRRADERHPHHGYCGGHPHEKLGEVQLGEEKSEGGRFHRRLDGKVPARLLIVSNGLAAEIGDETSQHVQRGAGYCRDMPAARMGAEQRRATTRCVEARRPRAKRVYLLDSFLGELGVGGMPTTMGRRTT